MVKNTMLSLFTCLSLLFAFGTPTFANDQHLESHISEEPVKVELIHQVQSIQPSTPFWVAIRFDIENNWHSYWKNPGDTGLPTTVKWKLPDGFTAGPSLFPVPKKFSLESLSGYGYDNEHLILVEITPPATLENEMTITASLDWLACSESACLPGMAEVSITLPITQETATLHPAFSPMIQQAIEELPKKEWGKSRAYRKQELIEVAFTAPHDHPFTPVTATFYPEEPQTIDDKVEAILTQDKQTGEYIVILKEADEREQKLSTLKGILALSNASGSEKTSFDLALAVKEESHAPTLISMSQETTTTAITTIATAESLFSGTFAFFLITAFIGGLILNLMPCVLPVISLKILSFVKMADKERPLIFKHGLSFFFGVLVSFWALAGALLILQASGNAVGWGFQLQDPLFVAIMIVIMLVFSLSLFGLFEIGTFFASWAGTTENKKRQETLTGSFFSGVFATAVATPCTGPFLGPAIGFAVAQPPILALLIFTFLGLGMATPYLLLSTFPSLLRFIPKPGNWMITFKEITGFILLATVLWLLWVFNGQTNSFALFLLLAGLLLIALGCWIYGKWCSPIKKRIVRLIGICVAAIVFGFGGTIILRASAPEIASLPQAEAAIHTSEAEGWEPFSRVRLESLIAEGTPVFVDFTARWCLICQVNHLVLTSKDVNDAFNSRGVVRMKADWTRYNSEITEELKLHGRNGVPLYLLYNGHHTPTILPQMLTPQMVITELKTLDQQQPS